MYGQHVAVSAGVDDARDSTVAAYQAHVHAPASTPFGLVSKDGDCAAAHEIEAVEVDHEWFRRGGGRGRLRDQILPSVLIGGVDLATRMDNHSRVVVLDGRLERVAHQVVNDPA